MSNKNTTFENDPSTKDLFDVYQKAKLRGNYYDCLAATSDTPKESKAYSKASEDQAEIEGNTHTQIVNSKPRDLEDVYATLVVLRDGLSRLFAKGDFTMQENAILLNRAIAWVETFSACKGESHPSDNVSEITSKKAA